MKEEIKDIIIRFLTGSISEDEKKKLNSWLKDNPENKEYFENQRNIWLLTGAFENDIDKRKKRVWKKITQKNKNTDVANGRKPIIINLKNSWVAAAMFVIALGIGSIFTLLIGNLQTENIQFAQSTNFNDTLRIISPKGSKTEVNLPDGSKVWLNSNSQIKFLSEFNNGKREVFLSGEAYFVIEKTSAKDKFHVNTSGIKINVLGTSFNVKAYPEEGVIETTLDEGLLNIERNNAGSDENVISLKPNQQAIFIKKDGKIRSEELRAHVTQQNQKSAGTEKRKEQFLLDQNVNTELYTAWKDGHLIIVGENFQNIIVKLERWYDVNIVLENESLSNIQFTANFKNETIEQALYALKLTHPFKYTYDITSNTIYIK